MMPFLQKSPPSLAFSGPSYGLDFESFDRWGPRLDEALTVIPEDQDYPHALIKLLARQRGGRKKKLWLIKQHARPLAIAPLRRSGLLAWKPVSQYILPGVVVPGVESRIFDALDALGVNLRIALWRSDCAMPRRSRIRNVVTTQTYGIGCGEDFEAYWKSTDIWRRLRSARNRWKALTPRENAPGASEWIITNWAKKWAVAEDEMQDRLAAARFLEERGRHFSLTLFDGDKPLVGQTCLNHRGEMIAQCFYRDSQDGLIGNRLIHETFLWAREKGFRAVDIGGGHDYKRKFAPPRSERHEFTIAPPLSDLSERAFYKARWHLGKLFKGSPAPPPGD